jgi:hypothetical protein
MVVVDTAAFGISGMPTTHANEHLKKRDVAQNKKTVRDSAA